MNTDDSMPEPKAASRMEKQRHGCLTAWLVFIIIANTLVALVVLLAGSNLADAGKFPLWVILVQIAANVAAIAFAIALFKWKKWGFYGFLGIGIVGLVVNLASGSNAVLAISGLVGPAILYAVLQIGGDRKGWTQLE
jgi:hypothetical protein